MAQASVFSLFLEFSRAKLLEQYWPRMKNCVESLADQQVWWRPNENSNSIGNLMLHLNGNVTQWIIAPFNRLQDKRDRPAEFSKREGVSRAELIATLGETVERAGQALANLKEADLVATYTIQGFTVSGLQAVYQVVEHFALHYGQVLYITKQLTGRDLALTKGHLDAAGRAMQPGKQP
jgi:hypothetical protein